LNVERYREFIERSIDIGSQIGRAADVAAKLMTSATLMYHLYTESGFWRPPKDDGFKPGGDPGPGLPGDPGPDINDPQPVGKKIEDKIKDPVPPQCFRHIYKDERGQLRTIVICKTEGHGQRIYHDM
jgi:hypothetical protein